MKTKMISLLAVAALSSASLAASFPAMADETDMIEEAAGSEESTAAEETIQDIVEDGQDTLKQDSENPQPVMQEETPAAQVETVKEETKETEGSEIAQTESMTIQETEQIETEEAASEADTENASMEEIVPDQSEDPMPAGEDAQPSRLIYADGSESVIDDYSYAGDRGAVKSGTIMVSKDGAENSCFTFSSFKSLLPTDLTVSTDDGEIVDIAITEWKSADNDMEDGLDLVSVRHGSERIVAVLDEEYAIDPEPGFSLCFDEASYDNANTNKTDTFRWAVGKIRGAWRIFKKNAAATRK